MAAKKPVIPSPTTISTTFIGRRQGQPNHFFGATGRLQILFGTIPKKNGNQTLTNI
jgi:hypothetical protein